jgi:hypothetical protein
MRHAGGSIPTPLGGYPPLRSDPLRSGHHTTAHLSRRFAFLTLRSEYDVAPPKDICRQARPGAEADLARLVELKRKDLGLPADAEVKLHTWDSSYYKDMLLKASTSCREGVRYAPLPQGRYGCN